MASFFVDIGAGVLVRADEVVVVHDDIPGDAELTVPTWKTPEPKSLVVLRSGQVIAGYLRAQTIRQRVEQALRDDN